MTITIQLALARARLVAKRSISRAASILADALIPLGEARALIRLWVAMYDKAKDAKPVAWPVRKLYVGAEAVA